MKSLPQRLALALISDVARLIQLVVLWVLAMIIVAFFAALGWRLLNFGWEMGLKFLS